MRHSLSLIAVLLVLAVPARAQVTVDLKALDAVPPAPSAPPTPTPKAAKPQAATPPRAAAPKTATQAPQPPAPPPASTTAKAPVAAQPSSMPVRPPLPVAPPPSAVLAPIPPPPPAAPAAPLLPAAVSASATGAAVPMAGGLSIGFGPGQGELSPASDQALQAFVRSLPHSDAISYNVVAYAAGTPEDPSTARRVSLARALSVRSVLMGTGVPSSRIYVRALGAAGGNGPADRVDVTALGANAPPASPEPPPTPKQP